MNRDCEHGRLARKCEICELIAAEAEIERLRAERNEQRARADRLG